MRILPALGFSQISDMSECSNQFYVDFVATKDGKRVLIDATVKLKAYVPKKAQLALALEMDLYILHVSPKNEKMFVLNKMPVNRVVSRVPAQRIREWMVS